MAKHSQRMEKSAARVPLPPVRDFTIAQRTLAILALAILAVAVVALVSWVSRPTYTPLYSGLSSADAAAIVDQLQSQGVQYGSGLYGPSSGFMMQLPPTPR